MDRTTEKLDDSLLLASIRAMPPIPRRREGFRGQSQIVVPPPVHRAFGPHPLLRGLFVTDAGFYPRAKGHLVERPQGASTHLLIACLHGRGWAKSGGRRFQLARGDVIALPAHQAHAYGAHDGAPWSIAWVHFTGAESDAWLELGVGGRRAATVCHVPPERLDALALDRVHRTLESGYGLRELAEAAAGLRLTLALVSRLRVQTSASVSAQERVAAAIARVREEFTASFRVTELAASAGLSTTHFSALFREQTGFSPVDFHLRVRVQRGANLLLTTRATVADIATLSGFADPYYFTRCFTRIMGSSPRAYRRGAATLRSRPGVA